MGTEDAGKNEQNSDGTRGSGPNGPGGVRGGRGGRVVGVRGGTMCGQVVAEIRASAATITN